jgi:hypothetical protein
VLDAACGTGSALAALSWAVRPEGRVLGVEQSAEMIALARERCAEIELRNVSLIASPVEEARIPGPVDAELYPPALSFLNFWVRWRVRDYASTREGLERPWRLLEAHVPDFTLAEVSYRGSGYIGSGVYVAR